MSKNSWCPIIDTLLNGKSLSHYWKLTTQHIPELFSIHGCIMHACSFTYCMNSDTRPGVTREYAAFPGNSVYPCWAMHHFLVKVYR